MRLAFGEEADLDLYVTDPAQDNRLLRERGLRGQRRRPGGRSALRRAGTPGRYRVGVDFPSRCGSHRGPVPFVLVAEFGDQRLERRREVALGQFLPVVLEFEHRH